MTSYGWSLDDFNDDEDEELQSQPINDANSGASKGKRKVTRARGIQKYFKVGVGNHSQPTIKACMQSKERWHDTDMAIALWLYDACIPINAVNSPFFQVAVNKIASMGHGYQAPSYHALRVNLLKEAK